MAKLSVSKDAESDLIEIWQYIAQDSVVSAERLHSLLYEKFKTLAQTPGIGRRRPELGLRIRSFPAGSYIIYYRSLGSRSEILRVIHGARDVADSVLE